MEKKIRHEEIDMRYLPFSLSHKSFLQIYKNNEKTTNKWASLWNRPPKRTPRL